MASKKSDQRLIQVELPTFTGEVKYQTEQAILRLREAIEFHVADLHARLDGLPPQLTLAEIQQELSPTGTYPLPTAALLNTATPPTSSGGSTPPPPIEDGIPDFLDIVTAVHAAFGITGASTPEEVFNFMRTVASDINNTPWQSDPALNPSGLVCGFTDAPSNGDNVFTCLGETYRYARVTFSNDHTFKILIDADPGGARTPNWADEGITAGLYRPNTVPGSPC